MQLFTANESSLQPMHTMPDERKRGMIVLKMSYNVEIKLKTNLEESIPCRGLEQDEHYLASRDPYGPFCHFFMLVSYSESVILPNLVLIGG